VLVYRPGGDTTRTPIIHRALFWVQVNGDGSYSIPSLHKPGQNHDHIASLDTPQVKALTGNCDPTGAFQMAAHAYGVDGSGFVTRGDNNNIADQCSGLGPARMAWILGKARGEVPWIGLVNLLWGDFTSGCNPECNYANAGGDSKVMFFVVVAVLIATPWVIELVLRRRRRRQDERGDDGDDDSDEAT
jgi:hypothetical protein